MTTHGVKTFATFLLGFTLITCTLMGCDSNSPEPDEPRTAELAFTQRNTQDQTLAQLGRYTVPLDDQPRLQGALTKEVTLKGFRGGMSYGRDGGDPDKDVVVFILTFDGKTGTESISGGAFQPGLGSPVGSPTRAENAETFQGTMYGFFVDGIGDRPDVPVEIVLNGSENTEKLVIDPEKHTLPDRFAFQVDERELSPREDVETRSSIQVEFVNSEELAENRIKEGPPYLAYAIRGEDQSYAGAAANTQSIGLEYEAPPTDYEFYLFLLQP